MGAYRRGPSWSAADDAFLRAQWHKMHPRDIGLALPDRKRSKSAVERRAAKLRLAIGPVGRPSKPPPKPPPEPQIIVQPVQEHDPLLAEIGLTPKDWIALNKWAPGDPSQWPWRRQTGSSP